MASPLRIWVNAPYAGLWILSPREDLREEEVDGIDWISLSRQFWVEWNGFLDHRHCQLLPEPRLPRPEVVATVDEVRLVLELLLQNGLDGSVVEVSIEDDEIRRFINDDGGRSDTVIAHQSNISKGRRLTCTCYTAGQRNKTTMDTDRHTDREGRRDGWTETNEHWVWFSSSNFTSHINIIWPFVSLHCPILCFRFNPISPFIISHLTFLTFNLLYLYPFLPLPIFVPFLIVYLIFHLTFSYLTFSHSFIYHFLLVCSSDHLTLDLTTYRIHYLIFLVIFLILYLILSFTLPECYRST